MNNLKIAITGASGWVGKNLLDALSRKINKENFRKNVFMYGSKSRNLSINAQLNNIKIRNINELVKDASNNNFNLIFHCAFIVREHVKSLGINKYVALNRQISEVVLRAIKENKSSKLLLFSSGAASMHKDFATTKTLETDPYGALKRDEELLFSDYIDTQIMRIYALSGRYFRNPDKFAMSNLLLQAKSKSKINLFSDRTIIRGYINAKDLSEISIGIVQNKEIFQKQKIIDAVSDEISLQNLANIISRKFNNIPIIHNIDENLQAEVYSSSPKYLRLISKKIGYDLMSIDQQIADTLIGLENIDIKKLNF